MALTTKQIQELNIAAQRRTTGKATATDLANLTYAETKLGYKYTPASTPSLSSVPINNNQSTQQPNVIGQLKSITPSVSNPVVSSAVKPSATVKTLTDQQKKELDIASQRIANKMGSSTDVANINYAKQNYGYSYNPQIVNTQPTSPTTVQPINIQPAVLQSKVLTDQQKKEIDKANLAYAEKAYGYKSSIIQPEIPVIEQLKIDNKNIEGQIQALDNTMAKPTELLPTDTLKKEISDLSIPTEEENNLQKQINVLKGSAEAGLNKIEDETIPMPFITGQQASLARIANTKLQTLTEQLALIQQKRQNALTQKQNEYQIEQDKIAREQELTKPIDVGGNIVKYNPKTGQYDTVYKSLESTKPVALSQGEILVDPITGKIIGKGEDKEIISENDELLSPTEAANLNVPYGTTKGQAVNLGVIPKSELTGKEEINTINSLIYQYSRSQLIQAADKMAGYNNNIQQASLPGKDGKYLSTNDLNILYSYIKMLDWGDSAVREGEINLGTDLGTIKQTVQGLYNKLLDNNGIMDENIRKSYVQSSQDLFNTISESARQKEKMFKSQANVVGVGEKWQKFREGFSTSYDINQVRYDDPQILNTMVQAYKKGDKAMVQAMLNDPETTNVEIKAVEDALGMSLSRLNDTKISSIQIPISSRLAYVNNNPGNLKYAWQKGATAGEGGFARFDTPEAGFQALKDQIALDTGRGHTLQSFINKYAPSTENNTELYIKQIEKMTGYNRNTPLNQIDKNKLAIAISQKESSTKIYA